MHQAGEEEAGAEELGAYAVISVAVLRLIGRLCSTAWSVDMRGRKVSLSVFFLLTYICIEV